MKTKPDFTSKEFHERIKAQLFPSILQSAEDERRQQLNAWPTIESQNEHWQAKRGRCQGCNLDIAVEDQYCHACESFLIESQQ